MIKIRKYEWDILRVNLIRSGISSLDAEHIIDNHKDLMDKQYEKFKEQIKLSKLTKEKAESQFKQSFWKICQKWEC